jgi:hypothetical protein
MLLTVQIPVEKGNQAIRDGAMPKIIQDFMTQNKPESAYFTVTNGERTAFFVLDISDSSAMPAIGEPMYMSLGAKLEFRPVMNVEELQRGLSALASS